MDIFRKMAEEKIVEAMENGEFDNLPGAGKPLDLREDPHVPAELRTMYRVMKKANIPPEEVLLRKRLGLLREKMEDPDLAPEEKRRLKKALLLLENETQIKLERFRKTYFGL